MIEYGVLIKDNRSGYGYVFYVEITRQVADKFRKLDHENSGPHSNISIMLFYASQSTGIDMTDEFDNPTEVFDIINGILGIDYDFQKLMKEI